MRLKNHNGFTLIELMIVVAILAILAAIALPAYRDYVTRAKVSELMMAAGACKVSVTEYYQTQATFPPDQAASGCTDQDSKYVAKLAVGDKGVILATAKTGAGAIDKDAAGDLELRPTVTATGQIDWACNTPGTTIPKKFLPANCR